MAAQEVTKPIALDETLQFTNGILQEIANALGGESIIGATDISGIADGTLTGATAEFDERIEDINEFIDTETTTIEGNPINFSTLSAQKAESTIIDLNPIQDLHGYDKPWVGGAGKNKLAPFEGGIKETTTLVVNSDGSAYFSGTATSTKSFDFERQLKAGIYILSGAPNGSSQGSYDMFISLSDSVIARSYSGSNLTQFTLESDSTVTVGIRASSGTLDSTKVFYPMIRLATETDATFEPYTNICPISGRTDIGILGTNGKESTDPDYEVSNNLTISLGQTVYGGTLDVENGVLVVDRKYVNLGDCNWGKTNSNQFYSTDAKDFKYVTVGDLRYATYFKCSNYNAVHNTSFATNGNVVMFRNEVYANEPKERIFIQDDTKASMTTTEFKSAMDGVDFVYELATPITINLTPHQISLLEGVNNISTTGDKITLTYRDGSVATLGDLLEVEKKISSATAQHNYSTEEQVVGTWIDGKPLYEKTVTFGVIPANSMNYLVDCSILTVDNLIDISCVIHSGNNFFKLPLPLLQQGETYSNYGANLSAFDKSTGKLRIDTGAQRAASGGYITLQYTKTTD